MEYKKLGRTGLRVSRLCLGTMNFGAGTEEKEAYKIMDAALDAGINFFDTANNYGFLVGKVGITEEIIGRWFQLGGGRREKTVLATKVHEDMFDETDGPNTKPGLSTYKIRRHLDKTLKRLQTDHVELYYLHHIYRKEDTLIISVSATIQHGKQLRPRRNLLQITNSVLLSSRRNTLWYIVISSLRYSRHAALTELEQLLTPHLAADFLHAA